MGYAEAARITAVDFDLLIEICGERRRMASSNAMNISDSVKGVFTTQAKLRLGVAKFLTTDNPCSRPAIAVNRRTGVRIPCGVIILSTTINRFDDDGFVVTCG